MANHAIFTSRHVLEVKFGFTRVYACLYEGSVPSILVQWFGVNKFVSSIFVHNVGFGCAIVKSALCAIVAQSALWGTSSANTSC